MMDGWPVVRKNNCFLFPSQPALLESRLQVAWAALSRACKVYMHAPAPPNWLSPSLPPSLSLLSLLPPPPLAREDPLALTSQPFFSSRDSCRGRVVRCRNPWSVSPSLTPIASTANLLSPPRLNARAAFPEETAPACPAVHVRRSRCACPAPRWALALSARACTRRGAEHPAVACKYRHILGQDHLPSRQDSHCALPFQGRRQVPACQHLLFREVRSHVRRLSWAGCWLQ